MYDNSIRRSTVVSGNPDSARGVTLEFIGILGLLAFGFAIVAIRLAIALDLPG